MPGLDWTKGIKIPEGLPDGEIERLNKIERGEQPSTGTEERLELPLHTPEMPTNKNPKPEKDREN